MDSAVEGNYSKRDVNRKSSYWTLADERPVWRNEINYRQFYHFFSSHKSRHILSDTYQKEGKLITNIQKVDKKVTLLFLKMYSFSFKI